MWHIYISIAVLFRGAYCNPVINTAKPSNCTVVIKRFGEQVTTLEVKWHSTIHLICDASCVGPGPQPDLTWFYLHKNQSKLINIEKLFRSPKFETYPINFHWKNELVIRDFGPNEETDFICRGSIKTQRLKAVVALIGTDCLLKYNFRCKLGNKCIDRAYLCNQHHECPDGEDEVGCGNDMNTATTVATIRIPEKGVVKEETSDESNYIDMTTMVSTMLMPETDVETKPTSKESNTSPGAETSRTKTTCRGDQFQCADGNCVEARMKCDGTPQCEDGSDELNCPNCPPNNFQCETTSQLECVDVSLVCNRFPDCTDRSDEVGCPPCRIDQFTCTDGNCVEGYMRCDGIAQCEDRSDEIGCPCPASDFQCANLQCIDLPMRDCVDRSDEIGCPTDVCLSDEFRCVNEQKCVSIAFRCNGIWDCEDGSDEADCGSEQTDGVLTIPDIQPSYAGNYVDTGTTDTGRTGSAVTRPDVEVKPAIPPTIVIQPSKTINAIVGQRVRMECIAQGEPIPTVYWINPLVPRLGNIVPKAGFQQTKGTAILDITNVGKENTGYYTCAAQNAGGRTEDKVQLIVQESQRAEVKISGPGTLSVVDGGSVELTCTASAILNPLIRWRRREGPLPPGHSLRGGILSIPRLTVEYGGEYICSTSSPEGSYQASIFIIVTAVTEAPPAVCTADQYKCANGECVDGRYLCDGQYDCHDGSDEENCPRCPPNNFMCETTSQLECVDVSLVCDRFPDCTDGSDEVGCSSCRIDQFTCTDGNCVEGNMRCDGRAQCEDRSDEIGCHEAWSEWTNISHCYARACNISCMIRKGPCDKGQMKQIRFCNNPSPGYGGRRCHGQVLRIVECENYVEPGWSEWGPVTCDKDCRSSENDTVSGYRRRTCNNPPPIHEKDTCCGYDIIDTEEDSNICNDLPLCIYTTASTTASSSTTKVTCPTKEGFDYGYTEPTDNAIKKDGDAAYDYSGCS